MFIVLKIDIIIYLRAFYLYNICILQKSISNSKCSCEKKYEINSNKIFAVVKMFHCLHLDVFID